MLKRSTITSALLFVVAVSASASAQEEPSLRSNIFDLTANIAAPQTGQAIGLATALEVANAPTGSSAGGFVFKLDPATGLRVRTAPTFGPSFTERALTAGEGKVRFGVSLAVATYDKLNKLDLKQMLLTHATGAGVSSQLDGYSSMVLSSQSTVISAAIGATDKFDVGVLVPIVKVKLDGTSWDQLPSGQVIEFMSRKIESSGLGDIGVTGKYRVAKFGEGQPDPGGIAVMLTTRLPTGSRENFRGLGITRVLGSVIASGGVGKFRPHGQVGFDWWEKGLEVDTDFTGNNRVGARHQVLAGGGFEFEAGPKVTLLTDVLFRKILGGGQVRVGDVPVPPAFIAKGVTSLTQAVATDKGIQKLTLAPGLKWNLKGSFVFAGNALISLADNGLHDMFTPVVGIDWTF
jgi:hypothetical protein